MQFGEGSGRNVLRGGSWNNDRDNARCAYRNNDNPDNWNDNIGLRLATRAPHPPEMWRAARVRRAAEATRRTTGRLLVGFARPNKTRAAPCGRQHADAWSGAFLCTTPAAVWYSNMAS
jgi:hypothetical protein